MTEQQETPRADVGSTKHGFAAMDARRQQEIAAKGGRAAHASGNAHQFSPEEARKAGAAGGRAAHARGRAHRFSSEEARLAGSKGGKAAHESGRAHQFTSEEAAAAGRKGGQSRQKHVAREGGVRSSLI